MLTTVETPMDIESNVNNITSTSETQSTTELSSPTVTKATKKTKSKITATATAISTAISTATSLSSILTRGKKRAKETYDFMFNIIEDKDLLTLFGFECTGPNDTELRVYFNLFPKQNAGVISKQDLEKFINETYSSDQVKSIDLDTVLKNVDLDESGEIEINDFVEYLEESIIEKSKSMGLIVELSSDEEKPKKKRKSIKKPVESNTKAKKSLKLKGKKVTHTKKQVEKEKAKKEKKTSKATTKKEKPVKPTKKVKYNFEKYHNATNTEDLETGVNTTNLGEGLTPFWQYQFNSQWLPYDKDAAIVVEEAYQDWLTNPNIDVRSVKSGVWAYQVDFKEMTQTNIQHQDHTTRSIRRILNK